MAVAPRLPRLVASQPTFAQLVSLACHDLRTPLATASGFAHTLKRLDTLQPPADRYVEMIGAASQQMGELLDLLSAAARIESGRFDPQPQEANSRVLADAAAETLDGRAAVAGDGAAVAVDPAWTQKALAALAECVRRHGGLEAVTLEVDGAAISIGPVTNEVAAIASGEELRDFSAAVATRVLEASGSTAALDGDRLVVRLAT